MWITKGLPFVYNNTLNYIFILLAKPLQFYLTGVQKVALTPMSGEVIAHLNGISELAYGSISSVTGMHSRAWLIYFGNGDTSD